MGREENLKLLLPYIEGALRNNAVDNYWFIDMTRKRSDHELIKVESKRLNDLFPGRVHLYNSEERGRVIDDKDKLAEATKSWETFYKFLSRFNDNDIIAKCDDDTYYIDIETLAAAYEFRWNNKKPYLMHSNCINNGLTAYQMNKKGVFNDKESEMYPLGGLTGPLFSHPEVACKHHDQFTRDMLANHSNINKYKLGKNIQFCNRVSINFIFMLGKDRHELSKITYQDEYDTSCKYPQRENRPNVIIGDFTIAHHTYGVQEPIMEKLQTHVGYEKLCEKLNSGDVEFEHKAIGTQLNATTTIAAGGKMLMRAWVENNSYVIQDPDTDEYLSLRHDDVDQGHSTGQKSHPDVTSDFKKACMFDIDVDKESPIYYHNSTSLLKSLSNCTNNGEMTFPFAAFFQGNYKDMTFVCERQNNGNYIIRCGKQREYCLTRKDAPGLENLKKVNEAAYNKLTTSLFLCNKNDPSVQPDKQWRLIPLRGHSNHVIAGSIHRPSNFHQYANDETYATGFVEDLPDNRCLREWIWMVKDYIWEMVPTPKENIFKIKLVADDKPNMYLFYNQGQDKLITGAGGDEFEFVDKAPKYLKHVKTGKYVNVTDDGQVVLQSNFAELAMCPQR
tara:strand:+ start:2417 stop:4264 length:1848 start_codon:yes stop_codon:yes gene_type:complete